MENIESIVNWKEELKKYLTEYGIKAKENEIDNTYEEAKKHGRHYRYPGNHINFICFNDQGLNYISLAESFDWTNKERHQSWSKNKIRNSYTGDKVFRTWLVFWVDCNFSFFHVKKNNYELLVNQCFQTDWYQESLEIKIFINDKEIIRIKDYPTTNDTQFRSSEYLKEDRLGFISKEDFEGLTPDEHGDYTVKVLYSHNSTKVPKHRWSLDGGRLLQISQLPKDFIRQPINNETNVPLKSKTQLFTEIKRDPVPDPIFSGHLKKNLILNLLGFLDLSDLVELSKVNVFLRNTISFYEDKYCGEDYWPVRFCLLCNNYGLKVEIKNFDNSFEKAKAEKRKYKCYNINRQYYGYNCDNYLSFNEDGISHISKLKDGDCDQDYRKFIDYTGSYDPDFNKVYYVKGSCWVCREIDFFHIKAGFYEFFIHHAFKDRFKKDSLMFHFIIYGKNKIKYIHETLFPSEETLNGRKKELYEESLCLIKKNDFDEVIENDDGGYMLRAYFVNNDGYCNVWKEGWIVDGGRLLEIDEKIYEIKAKIIDH